MRTRFVLCALLFAAGTAHAQDPIRAELAAALEGRAAALSPKAGLREYAVLFRAEDKPKAKARLDGLDRAKLSAANVRELSEAYVLLGYFEAGAALGQTLQDRDPTGTQGLKLAAWAKIEGKDFAGAVALAQEALKINPNDKDAAALLYSAKGRIASSSPVPAPINPTPLSPMMHEVPATRTPLVFTPRPKNGVPSPSIPSPTEAAIETEGLVSRAAKWVTRAMDDATEKGLKRVDRSLGLKPGEEKIALAGARNGAVVGIGTGVVLGLGGGAVGCAVARKIGVPYGPCVAAAGVGGVLVFTPVGAYFGVAAPVIYTRTMASIDKIFTSHPQDDSSEAQ